MASPLTLSGQCGSWKNTNIEMTATFPHNKVSATLSLRNTWVTWTDAEGERTQTVKLALLSTAQHGLRVRRPMKMLILLDSLPGFHKAKKKIHFLSPTASEVLAQCSWLSRRGERTKHSSTRHDPLQAAGKRFILPSLLSRFTAITQRGALLLWFPHFFVKRCSFRYHIV